MKVQDARNSKLTVPHLFFFESVVMETKSIPLQKTFALHEAKPDLDAQIRKVGDLYEGQFLDQMVKEMRGTVEHSELTKPGFAEEIFQGNLDQEYVKSWVGRGGIGLSDLIYKQMKEQLMGRNFQKPAGPIPLENKNNFKMQSLPNEGKKKDFKIETSQNDAMPITAPWDGKIQNVLRAPDGKQAVWLEHADGTKTSYLFSGRVNSTEIGKLITKGEPIGVLSPHQSLYFSVQQA